MADAPRSPTRIDCPFCAQRARDVAGLRREGVRGKQLGIWEREILRRSGRSDLRMSTGDRSDGLPLLREVVPARDFRVEWDSNLSPSQPVVRAAGARLERSGLISLLSPTAREARLWIVAFVGQDWEHTDAVRKRLLLTNFSWRTLLGDEIVSAYSAVFSVPGSKARMRWDNRLDQAHAVADQSCSVGHGEQTLAAWQAALSNSRRDAAARR